MSMATDGGDGDVDELYAASRVYLTDAARAEDVVRAVLVRGFPADRRVLHRSVYVAAVDAGASSADPREDGSRLERAVSELPLRSRASLFLVDGCGFRYAEVAGILGVAPARIPVHVSTGRERLRATILAGGSNAPVRRSWRRRSVVRS